ncbi:hypothetical protein CYMTET_24856, partial [Cymbomonas tetramitiformis]
MGDSSQLLLDYTPVDSKQLAVQSKKVEEVRSWMTFQIQSFGTSRGALVLKGPAGCGKSATVKVLARELGFELCEWITPAPILWSEYNHHKITGAAYSSKLDDFEEFISRATNYSALPVTCLQARASNSSLTERGPQAGRVGGRAPRLVLVDDIPFAGEEPQRRRLLALLSSLARSTRCACVIILTTPPGTGKGREVSVGDKQGIALAEVEEALAAGGSFTIAFNAVTARNLTEALRSMAQKLAWQVNAKELGRIAEAARGDVRHALQSVHLRMGGMVPRGGIASRGAGARKKRRLQSRAGSATMEEGWRGGVRDTSYNTFHAIGKLLYNKRGDPASAPAGGCGISIGHTSSADGGLCTEEPAGGCAILALAVRCHLLTVACVIEEPAGGCGISIGHMPSGDGGLCTEEPAGGCGISIGHTSSADGGLCTEEPAGGCGISIGH